MKITPNKNTHWQVRNLNGTSGLKCQCGSWLAHWYNYTRSRRTTCAVVSCSRQAEVGAHVCSTDRRTDVKWWIAPFCKGHNHYSFTDAVFLKSEIELVSANKAYSCS